MNLYLVALWRDFDVWTMRQVSVFTDEKLANEEFKRVRKILGEELPFVAPAKNEKNVFEIGSRKVTIEPIVSDSPLVVCSTDKTVSSNGIVSVSYPVEYEDYDPWEEDEYCEQDWSDYLYEKQLNYVDLLTDMEMILRGIRQRY